MKDTKYMKSYFLKRTLKRIFTLLLLIIILIFIAFKLLSAYSPAYNDLLAKKEFIKMCRFIESAETCYINLFANDYSGHVFSGNIDINQIKNIDKLSQSLTYSRLIPKNESTSTEDIEYYIRFQIHFNYYFFDFSTYNSIDFQVHCYSKYIDVKSQVLTDFIRSDTFQQIQKDWNLLL